MNCSTVCAAAVGAFTMATIFGVGSALTLPLALGALRHQPEVQNEIINSFVAITLTAATAGAGLGILAKKATRCAYQRITGNQ